MTFSHWTVGDTDMSLALSTRRSFVISNYKYIALKLVGLFFILFSSVKRYTRSQSQPAIIRVTNVMSDLSMVSGHTRTPVYFLGIGGPNFMENHDHPAYTKLQAIGQEITTQVKPKAVVVLSAHWQAGPSRIEINIAEDTDIIYDFYGFPPHYYQYDYPNKGSPEIASRVARKLEGAGIEVDRVRRGLDHGVWVGFMAGMLLAFFALYASFITLLMPLLTAFHPRENPLNVPIVQVSLYDNEDSDKHYELGQALESLRDEGILIIGAGMAVHNLHDYRAMRGSSRTMP